MRLRQTLQLATTLILGLGHTTGEAQVQTYYFSGPVGGTFNGSGFIDAELTPGGTGQGGIQIIFGTLTETLYYNPTAQTLEQVGCVAIHPWGGSFNIEDSLSPPDVVGSATLTVGNNGIVSFDDKSYQYFGGGLFGSDLSIPVSGWGTYNGQNFSTNWNLDIGLFTQIISASPTSLTFDEVQQNRQPYGTPVVDGLCTGNGDATYGESWNLDAGVATTNVPDSGSTLALFIFALSALAFLRRR